MKASVWSTATSAQITGAHALVELALAEEPDEAMQQALSKTATELHFYAAHGTLLLLLRRTVEALRDSALPGGECRTAANAWLALEENGGAA